MLTLEHIPDSVGMTISFVYLHVWDPRANRQDALQRAPIYMLGPPDALPWLACSQTSGSEHNRQGLSAKEGLTPGVFIFRVATRCIHPGGPGGSCGHGVGRLSERAERRRRGRGREHCRRDRSNTGARGHRRDRPEPARGAQRLRAPRPSAGPVAHVATATANACTRCVCRV